VPRVVGIRRGSTVVDDTPTGQPAVEVQVVNWPRSVPPTVRVFIDGECIAALTNKRVHTFPVAPGVREVRARCRGMRSQAVALALAPGDRAALECGFDESWRSGFRAIRLVLWLAAFPLTALLRLPLTSAAVLGLSAVALGIAIGRTFLAPGACLYLRARAAVPSPGATEPGAPRLPRMTTRRWMVAIAVVAAVLGLAAHERAMQHRAEYRSRRDLYEEQARWFAESEESSKQDEAKWAESERAGLAELESLKTISASRPGDAGVQQKLRELERLLEVVRSIRASNARMRAYFARMKEKYRRAASRPWEAVEADPPYPAAGP
jgi:hypothetical protein